MIRKSQVQAATKRRQRAWGRKLRGLRTLFTKSEVEEIRKAYVETESTRKALAREYEVSIATISNVLCGRGPYTYDEEALRCPHGTKLD